MALRSLPPVIDSESKVLVLGTMPGPLSLAKGEYYAHPRNAFWRIASDLLHFDPELPYPLRLRRLLAHGIGLWDVLHSCIREGAADAAIKDEVPNDFNSLLLQHPTIKYIFLNGSTADRLFTQHVLPQLPPGSLSQFRLPSTSPANAAIGYEQKLLQWRAIAAPIKSFQGATPSTTIPCSGSCATGLPPSCCDLPFVQAGLKPDTKG